MIIGIGIPPAPEKESVPALRPHQPTAPSPPLAATTPERHEVKLVVPRCRAAEVSMWLRLHIARFAPLHPARWINNIYFDTDEYASLVESIEGALQRMKVRLRWYGDLDPVRDPVLELKCKHGPMNWKRSARISAHFPLAAQPWRRILHAIREEIPADLRLILDHSPCPSLINRYHREYYGSFDRSVRVTIDDRLQWWPQRGGIRPNCRYRTTPHDHIVIEFKALRRCGALLSDAINTFGPVATKHSKYTVGLVGIT